MENKMVGNPLDGLLTEPELARALKDREIKAGSRTLRTWRQRRIGPPFVRLGKTILYPKDGFASWLESGTQQPRRA
jgi:hypothetical protein